MEFWKGIRDNVACILQLSKENILLGHIGPTALKPLCKKWHIIKIFIRNMIDEREKRIYRTSLEMSCF
jgi:hypothetical protein